MCTHGGHPLESPLVIIHPHVMSLHQSAPLIKSLNHLARSVWAHSSLIRHTVSRWWVRSSLLCCTRSRLRFYSTCWRYCTICLWAMSVSVLCLEDAPTKNWEPGPKRCRGTIPLPENWIMRSIAAVWLVSVMAFHFFSGVGPIFLYLFSFL